MDNVWFSGGGNEQTRCKAVDRQSSNGSSFGGDTLPVAPRSMRFQMRYSLEAPYKNPQHLLSEQGINTAIFMKY